MFAFIDNLGGTELLLVFVVALLVFGRRLPQVAGDAAKQMTKLRRSLDAAWRDTGMDKEIQQVRRDIDAAIPRDLSIGDMARAASAEMDRRLRASETEKPKELEPPKETPPPSAGGTEKTSTLVDF